MYNAPKLNVSNNISGKVNSKVQISVSITFDSLDPNTYTYRWWSQRDYETNSGHRTLITDDNTYAGSKTATLTIYTEFYAYTKYFAFQIIGQGITVERNNIKVTIS